MCFSAEASFIAGGILSIAGIVTLAKTQNPSYRALASIPLLFGLQQIGEGFVWLGLSGLGFEGQLQFRTYVFLFFSQVLRPSRIPRSMYIAENQERKKKIIGGLLIIGLLASIYLAYCIFAFGGTASIMEHHISYNLSFPYRPARIAGLFYIIATIVPWFISSIPNMKRLGTLLFASLAISLIFFMQYFISVWCFFAAVASILIYKVVATARTIDKKIL